MKLNCFSKITKFTFFALVGIFASCSNDSNSDNFAVLENTANPDNQPSQNTPISKYIENTSSRNIISEDIQTISFANKLFLNLTGFSASSDNSTWTPLSAEEKTIITDSASKKITVKYDSSTGALTVNSSKSSETLQIIISGTAEKAHLVFENKKETEIGILLNSFVLNSSGNYPAISFDKKAKVYLQIEGENKITDGRTYGYGYGAEYSTSSSNTYTDSDGNTVNCTESKNPVADGADTKGTIYSKGPLILSGTGELILTENYKHGIYSKDYIRVFSGIWNIASSGRNGIQSVNGFVMDDGEITIKGTGTNINNQSRGIIVEGAEDETNPGEGFIVIKGGTIDIDTVSKGISAKWDITEDAETSVTTDDPYPYVKISGGKITIRTRGTPADESSRVYSFTDANGTTVSEKTKLSPEGIEGKVSVFIEGGDLDIQTTDDCINASRSGYATLSISGGKIYAYSSKNDAIDSNGTLSISGGTIVALTASTPECAFDCDNYNFSITGGTFIGIGTTNYSKPTASVTSQSTVVLSGDYLGTTGKTFTLGQTLANPVFAYTIDSSIFSNMSSNYIAIISSPEIKKNTSYSLFTNTTVNGGSSFHGLYTNLSEASSGTTKTTGIQTTETSPVYTLSSSTNGGAQEGFHGNPQDGNQPDPRF